MSAIAAVFPSDVAQRRERAIALLRQAGEPLARVALTAAGWQLEIVAAADYLLLERLRSPLSEYRQSRHAIGMAEGLAALRRAYPALTPEMVEAAHQFLGATDQECVELRTPRLC